MSISPESMQVTGESPAVFHHTFAGFYCAGLPRRARYVSSGWRPLTARFMRSLAARSFFSLDIPDGR